MSRLNTIPFSSKGRSVPSGPAGSSFRTVGGNSFGSHRGGGSKKGHAGSVAGLRGGRPTRGATTPKGPSTSFPSTNLGARRAFASAPKPTTARTSLLNRVVGRARRAFGS